MKLTDNILKLNEFLYLNKMTYITPQSISNQEANYETFVFPIQSSESLSKNFKLPLNIQGTFLRPGKPKERYYSLSTLQEVPNKTKLPIPFHHDHKDKESSSVVGAVTKLSVEGGVGRYFGHVNDETTARNILDKVINEISVTIFSTPIKRLEYETEGIDAYLTEISFVKSGAEEGNTLEVVK